jgi:Fe-S-cluster-containing hydrogenase component 2
MAIIPGVMQVDEATLIARQDIVSQRNYWPAAQYIVLLAGVLLVATLLLRPAVGLLIMWNVLIPIAPALIVVAPGLWRNICPMATFSLLPRNLKLSRQGIPQRRLAALLSAAGLVALLLIVPLRHLSLNTNGQMTALMLSLSAAVAFWMGTRFEWRSGWCNSLCPIHPAEKLYGLSPAITLFNARCNTCKKCTSPCPDSTRSMNAAITGPTQLEKLAGNLMVGGFAGFIWGWYRLPDIRGHIGIHDFGTAYFWPFAGALITLSAYAITRAWICRTKSDRDTMVKVFAAAAVCTYYWYRIPELFGFGSHPGTGLLYNLSHTLPDITLVSHILTTSFFVWFMVIRNASNQSWLKRPKSER